MQPSYTEEQKREFKDRFKQRRSRQLILAVPVIALIFLRPWLRENPESALAGMDPGWVGGLVVVFVVGALVFSFKNWRCPACNGYLGKTVSPRFCQKCGVELS